MWILKYCEYVISSFKKFTVLIIRNTEGTTCGGRNGLPFWCFDRVYYIINRYTSTFIWWTTRVTTFYSHKEELGRHENVDFATTKMRLLFFQNLQKRLLTCKRAWQKSTNALPTIVHDSLKPPRMILLSATGGHTGQFCELSSGNHHQ